MGMTYEVGYDHLLDHRLRADILSGLGALCFRTFAQSRQMWPIFHVVRRFNLVHISQSEVEVCFWLISTKLCTMWSDSLSPSKVCGMGAGRWITADGHIVAHRLRRK